MGCVNGHTESPSDSMRLRIDHHEKKQMSDFDIYVITQALFGKKLSTRIKNISIQREGIKRILYIEDNPVYHILIKKILSNIKNHQFKLTIKSNIKESIEYIDKNCKNIDLILLDVILPDGYCDVILDQLFAKKYNMNHIIIISRLASLDAKPYKYTEQLSYCSKPLNLNHFQKTLEGIFIDKKACIFDQNDIIEEEPVEEKEKIDKN